MNIKTLIENLVQYTKKKVDFVSKEVNETIDWFYNRFRIDLKNISLESFKSLKIDCLINKYKKIKLEKGNYPLINIKEEDVLLISKSNMIDFCRVLIDYIKEKLNVFHNDFDIYIEIIKKKNLNKEKIIEDVVSDNTIKFLLQKSNINNTPKNFLQAKRCAQVIALALINCNNFNGLKDSLINLTGLSDRQIYLDIKNCMTCLGEIYNFNISHWLPKKYHSPYSFKEIKDYINKKGWNLLSPKDQKDFDNFKKKVRGNQEVPLLIHCNNLEHLEWSTTFRSILNNDSNCRDCSTNAFTYSRIKKMVEDLGIKISGRKGILISPKDNKTFLQMRRDTCVQPSYIFIVVSCNKLTHEYFTTNAMKVYLEKWCYECFLERLTKYDFDFIKSLVEHNGGKLINPANKEEYDILLNQLKNEKDKYNSPNLLPLEISCNKGHLPFKTTPDNITQDHWCPLCGERYSVVGILIHPIIEFLILKLFLLKNCNAKYEEELNYDKKRIVDIIIERNKIFIENVEKKQYILTINDSINFIIIDFTIGINSQGIIDHCIRGYQNNNRLLIIVLLRFKSRRDEDDIKRIQDAIFNDPNINNNLKKNIILFTSDQFLEFLNLKFNISKWNIDKEEIKDLKEEIKIIQEYKKILEIIEDVLNSDSKYDELINNLSKLSDFYKRKLLNL